MGGGVAVGQMRDAPLEGSRREQVDSGHYWRLELLETSRCYMCVAPKHAWRYYLRYEVKK
jgi:hypothetical protein